MTNPEAGDLEDFASLFEDSLKNLVSGFEPGQEVKGIITDMNENVVFIDVGAKSEGVVDRQEFVDKTGELTVGVGDTITVHFVTMQDGEFRFSSRISGQAAERLLEDAYHSGIPVEGVVVEERKGGYSVMIGGRKAFCPYSQIEIFGAGPAEQYLHNSFTFLITQFGDRDLVVSRRRVLERERTQKREALVETLEPGMVVHGVVRNIRPFGVFVDLGGAEGLIPMGELAWERVEDASSIVQIGQEVDVVVTAIDWAQDRLSLSLRRAGTDPWSDVETRWTVGQRTLGRVLRIIPPGAIVSLEAGIDGLIHISKLGGGRRLASAGEVLEVGQELEIIIESIDPESRRISLSPVEYAEAEEGVSKLGPGDVTTGIVESIKDFGVFINLGGGKSGLLHVSRLGLENPAFKVREMQKQFPVNSTVQVEILDITDGGNRISLGLPGEDPEGEDEPVKDYKPKEDRSSFGSIADLFNGL